MSKTISDIASVIDCLHATPEYSSSGYPMVRVENVKNDFLNLSECYLVDEATCDYHNKNYTPKRDDIIITRVGSFGLIALVDTDDKFCLGQNIAIISPYQNGKFLYYYLQSPYIQKFIHGNSGGSSYKSLSLEHIKRLPLVIDGLKISKIESILYNIDTKIHNNNAICADLEGMAKLLYDYWFVQFDFPDENGKPYKSSGGKMVWNEELKREIPDGWKVRSISDICDIVDCLHSKKPEYCFENSDCYLLTLENLTKEGHIDLSEKFYISRADYDMWTSKIELQEGDFVITNAGRAGDIGRIPKNVHCAIGRNLTAIRPKKISSIYLNMFLHSYYIQTQIMSNLDQGSFFTSFNVHAIKKLMVLVPNESMMETAIHKFTDIVNRIEDLNAENQELASLRDFLLPMLMNGQVKVKEGETQ